MVPELGRLEPVLKVALSLYSNPGIYALLIGSGLSKSAGIPTGWEIVLDLVHKVAQMEGATPAPDPETWYKNRFGEPPDYGRLLDRLTSTSVERSALLRSYFEPTEEEREQGLKMPTPAHRAIAALVRLGYIRMILTTNFDRLLERALEEEGVFPDVIKSDDDLQGAMPYVHSSCYLVKLHGDYLDTRIKNTPEELANYSASLNLLLDRIFDEFGLIVCGWSGEWDTALRQAILRCPNRRFPMYWLAKGEPTEKAKEIIHHRRAEVIYIESADQFFPSLQEKIESLRELERQHPLSTAVAVEMVKRYVVEPRHRIRLHDLIREEVERVYQELLSERFNPSISPTKEVFQQRLHQYEAIVDRLMAMLTALAYHDSGENAYLLTDCIEHLIYFPLPKSGYYQVWLNLRYYPALLLTYATGIAALASKRFRNLAAILREAKYTDEFRADRHHAIKRLHVWSVFEGETYKWVPRPNADREYTPANNYLFERLRPVLQNYLPNDIKYEEMFDIFEYLLAINYIDLLNSHWSPIGRFGWRYKYSLWKNSPVLDFIDTGLKLGSNWDLLQVGFFQGLAERFNDIVRQHQEWVQKVVMNWW